MEKDGDDAGCVSEWAFGYNEVLLCSVVQFRIANI